MLGLVLYAPEAVRSKYNFLNFLNHKYISPTVKARDFIVRCLGLFPLTQNPAAQV